jgi:transcription-repair coupling factor (superfamily II helicase)
VPEPARSLLEVAHLRAECARTGVREVAVARDVIRLSPLALKASQTIRIQRLYPKAVYKEDLGQIVMPLPRGAQAAEHVRAFLQAVVPE